MAVTPEFEAVLERLRDTSRAIPTASLYHLSDLSRSDLNALEAIWPELPTERRHSILQDLAEIGEANFEVSFESVYRLGLEDEASEVRATAIRALWEAEDPSLIALFIDFMLHDPDPLVRAAAATSLGRFVYLGELEELPAQHARRVEEALLQVIGGDDELEVRRRALEALGFSSRPEVEPLISAAYRSDELPLRVSAVYAMGRTADARWAAQVQAELDSAESEMRFEAARAAGELEMTEAGPDLAQLVEDPDVQVREAAIWSLGQIGGAFARQTLNELLEATEDEDEQDFVQEALENLDFVDEVQAFSLLEFGEDEDEEEESSEYGAEDEAA